MLHGQQGMYDPRVRCSPFKETTEVGTILDKQPSISVAARGQVPRLGIQDRQVLLEFQPSYCPTTLPIQVCRKQYRAPRGRRHAQSKVWIERAHRVADGNQSRWPSLEAFVVHHATGGGAVMMDGRGWPRKGKRLSQLAIPETRDEVDESHVIGGKRLTGRSQQHDGPNATTRAPH